MLPFKNEHIIGTAGALATAAGIGMTVNANKRIKEKEKKGEEVTALDRAQQIGGGVIATAGTTAAVDGLAFNGKGWKSIPKLRERLEDKIFDATHDEHGKLTQKLKFRKTEMIGIGAIVALVGYQAFKSLSHKPTKDQAPDADKDPVQETGGNWVNKVNSRATPNPQQPALH